MPAFGFAQQLDEVRYDPLLAEGAHGADRGAANARIRIRGATHDFGQGALDLAPGGEFDKGLAHFPGALGQAGH